MEDWLMLLPDILVVLIIITLALDIRKQKKIGKYDEKVSTLSLMALAILYVPILIVSIYCLIKSNPHLKTWRLRTSYISAAIVLICVVFRRLKNRS